MRSRRIACTLLALCARTPARPLACMLISLMENTDDDAGVAGAFLRYQIYA